MPGRKAYDEFEGKGRAGGRVEGSVSQSPGGSWELLEDILCQGNGHPQKGSEPGKVTASLASVSWALPAAGHSGPPSPPPPPRWGPLTSGTSCPFSMISDSILPLAEPELTSARRRSPVDRWV